MRGLRDIAIFATVSVALMISSAASAYAQVNFDQADRENYGDWVVECIKDADPQPGTCQLYQRVLTQDPNTAALVVAIAWSTANSALDTQISLPLGINLRNPATLQVDGAAVETFAFSRCLTSGCMIEAQLGEETLSALLGGDTASVAVVGPGGVNIPIPLSLNGFAAGLAKIAPQEVLR